MESMFFHGGLLAAALLVGVLVLFKAPQRLIVITPAVLAVLPYLDRQLPHLPVVTPTRVFLLVSIACLLQVRIDSTSRMRRTIIWAIAYFIVVLGLTVGQGLSAQTVGNAVDVGLFSYLYFAVLYPRAGKLQLGTGTALVAMATLLVEVVIGAREFSSGSYVIQYKDRGDPLAYAGTSLSVGIRAVGTFVTTETYSLFCALLGLFLMGFWLHRQRTMLACLCASVALAGCMFSGSRDIVIFFVPLAVIMYLRAGGSTTVRTVATAVLSIPTLIIGNLLFQPFAQQGTLSGRIENQSNIDARLASFQAAWHIFLDHPLAGVGFGRYSEVAIQGQYQYLFHGSSSVPFPHNTYLSVLAETGLVGAFVFAALWLSIMRRLWLDSAREVAVLVASLVLLTSLGLNLGQVPASLNPAVFFIAVSTSAAVRPKRATAPANHSWSLDQVPTA